LHHARYEIPDQHAEQDGERLHQERGSVRHLDEEIALDERQERLRCPHPALSGKSGPIWSNTSCRPGSRRAQETIVPRDARIAPNRSEKALPSRSTSAIRCLVPPTCRSTVQRQRGSPGGESRPRTASM